jgi:hypothetical protein
MNRSAAGWLQVAMLLLGLSTLAFLLGEPHLESRNAHATAYEIYFHDPFLVFVYAGSLPFFVALYRAFGLFEHVRQTGTFSQVTMAALRTIKRCAVIIIGFVAVGMVFIIRSADEDDRPAGVVMGLAVALASGAVALAAARCARNLQTALSGSEYRQT